jgi:2-polyprenyl-3-methyl-5-hydroxy-6-metoxy-1,4-benzoquinol methylase
VSTHQQEIAQGQRFQFGANWKLFLAGLDESGIALAEQSLRARLGLDSLAGKRFLDIGSGSGLFSLAARRLGATVHSFDYDPDSVACTRELKRRYYADDAQWSVEAGSVLDEAYLQGLGQWDVVYSWGVLHHTGDQWRALAHVAGLVADGGRLFIALYNDQGWGSRMWTRTKAAYCASPRPLKAVLLALSMIRLWGPTTVRDILKGRPGATWRAYGEGDGRGMTPWRDVVDWVGGYPFEVSRPEEVFDFFRARGFHLEKLKTCGGGHGCNEFVFVKDSG